MNTMKNLAEAGNRIMKGFQRYSCDNEITSFAVF